ncbi:MAG: hypothetical protein IPM38_04700 [Ignavibacteria bacterium]|nr:hypothetical protein [Ignavibacteria bacterium]
MHLAKELTPLTLESIGLNFGGKITQPFCMQTTSSLTSLRKTLTF